MLGVVHADQRGGEDLVSGHRHADAVRELHHPLLLQIRQPDVALDQVVLQDLGALEFHLEVRGLEMATPIL